jgi:hypothetical protein
MAHESHSVVISVDQDHLADIEKVVRDLSDAGLQVERTLGSLGVITGKIAQEDMHRLAPIEGVAHVEEQREVRAL